MDALVRKGVKHLTVIANDGGLDAGQPAGEFAGKTARGVGKLLEHHMVDHIIASHLGVNPKLNEQFAEGTLEYPSFRRELWLKRSEPLLTAWAES